MDGAFQAMSDGNVDLNWAKEHHSLWVKEEIQAPGSKREAMRPAE
jgi:formate dehydrogenase subunit gamma